MKRFFCMLMIAVLMIPSVSLAEKPGKIDLNVSAMNQVMSFAVVKSIIETPKTYTGRRAKITGWYKQSVNSKTNEMDRFLTVVDMTACCFTDGSIYLELIVDEEQDFVFPEEGQQCEIVGPFVYS